MEFKASTMTRMLLFICIASVFISQGNACITCNQRACEKPTGCKYGIVKDMCLCCNVCAKGLGEDCGELWDRAGKCGKGFKCSPSSDEERGKCVKDENDIPE